jgi:hypothetical protein
MKIFINEHNMEESFRVAILNIARLHKVINADYKSTIELYLEISLLKTPLWDILNDYLVAYKRWFDFYQYYKEIEQNTGQEYTYNNDEKAKLAILIQNRQDTLDELQKQYDVLRK